CYIQLPQTHICIAHDREQGIDDKGNNGWGVSYTTYANFSKGGKGEG
ncbi:unnamed protein product, partial [marine sediment metagenome]